MVLNSVVKVGFMEKRFEQKLVGDEEVRQRVYWERVFQAKEISEADTVEEEQRGQRD